MSRTDFDAARDELLSHIHRCGVLRATTEQQEVWLDETAEFLSERYPSLTEIEQDELKQIGRRFCGPVISGGDIQDG